MKILVVDDEALARQRLRLLIESLPELQAQVIGEASNADEALQALREEAADVVLLDIGLPGRDGLKLASALKTLPLPPAVVFVTAYAEHALQAFDLQALDYLTKPVRRERLLAALRRVPSRAAELLVAPEPVIVVSDRGRVLRLPVAEALYLRAEQKYVTLRTAQHSHVLDDALADLELRLGPSFVRVHRNALVAVAAIRSLELRGAEHEGWSVQIAPLDEWLPVSRRQLGAVRAALKLV